MQMIFLLSKTRRNKQKIFYRIITSELKYMEIKN